MVEAVPPTGPLLQVKGWRKAKPRWVQEGQVIGRIGDEDGHCEPKVCLHLGAKVGEDYRDPLPFFDGPERVVLLPMQ